MGKYNFLLKSLTNDKIVDLELVRLDIEAKANIANELAEANRLKRIELKIQCKKYDLPNTEKELDGYAKIQNGGDSYHRLEETVALLQNLLKESEKE